MSLINCEGELALHRNDIGDNLMIVTVRVARRSAVGKKKSERARTKKRGKGREKGAGVH